MTEKETDSEELQSMLEKKNNSSDEPCEICGGNGDGWADLIVTCSKCHKSPEHIYCMHPNLDKVPEFWVCETCQYHSINHPYDFEFNGPKRDCMEAVHDSTNREKACFTENAASKILDMSNMVGSSTGKPRTHSVSRNLVARTVETGKVKFLPPEDVSKLSYGANPEPFSLESDPSSQKGTFCTDNRPTPKKSPLDATSLRFNQEKDHSYKPVAHLKPLGKQSVMLSQPLHGLKSPSRFPCKSLETGNIRSAEVITWRDKSHISDRAHISPPKINELVDCGVKEKSEFKATLPRLDKHAGKVENLVSEDCVCKETDVSAAVRFVGDGTSKSKALENGTSNSKISSKFTEDLPNPPAVNASWRGSFKILDTCELYDRFEAYPPVDVSPKAYTVSKEMPTVLQFTLQSRHDVWPEIFCLESPSAFDIAIYFLADNFCRSREKYSHLQEMMDKKDLSLLCYLDGVQLLVFTSKQLPVESQRMNKQLYLWGVFVSLKSQHSSIDLGRKEHAIRVLNYGISKDSASVNPEVNDQVLDMEVVVMEGKIVGSVDECLRRNSRTACWDNLNSAPQELCAIVHSDKPINNSAVARHLHQIKEEKVNDEDADMEIDMVGGIEVGTVDLCLRRNYRTANWQNKDIPCQNMFTTVLSYGPIEVPTVARHMHQGQCADLDSPPGFSRPFTNDDMAISDRMRCHLLPQSGFSSGFSNLVKLEHGDSSSKVTYNYF